MLTTDEYTKIYAEDGFDMTDEDEEEVNEDGDDDFGDEDSE